MKHNLERELNLPNAINEGQLRLLILDSFILLGESLGNFYDSRLSPLLGTNWVKDLAKSRNIFSYNLVDPDWVIKEPLRNTTSPTRLILPKGQGFYNKLNLLAKTRNSYFHNKANCNLETVTTTLELFLNFSLEIPLNEPIQSYSKALSRLKELADGKNFVEEKDGLFRIQLLEQQVADMEEIANQQKREIQKQQFILDAALDDVAAYADKIRVFEEAVDGRDQLIADATAAKVEAEKLVERLQAEFDAKMSDLSEKEHLERQYKELLNSLVENKTVASINGHVDSVNPQLDDSIKPGSIWTGEKGLRRLTLSVNFRELYDTKTGDLLRDKYGSAATELAEEWLRIKPQGGRVFVDENGRATAYQGENLVYLGKITFL